MIITDPNRQLPTLWSDELCRQLVEHAIDLGHHGNPPGFMLTVDLYPFIGRDCGETHVLKPDDTWDYKGIRGWIAANQDRVLRVWQYQVRDF